MQQNKSGDSKGVKDMLSICSRTMEERKAGRISCGVITAHATGTEELRRQSRSEGSGDRDGEAQDGERSDRGADPGRLESAVFNRGEWTRDGTFSRGLC